MHAAIFESRIVARILVIEDEIKTANSLQKGLTENGYEVEVAYDGETALTMAREQQFDLLIMDVILPLINGLSVCRILRSENNPTPVIMLTALSMTADKLRGFEAGSDDYVVKPFDFAELLARVKVALARGKNPPTANKLTYADLEVDLNTMDVRRGGKTIPLTAKEFSLLLHFIRNPEKILSREDIARKVWDLKFDTGTNFVEVYISYLRNKIDKGFDSKLLHTRKGLGYILRKD